jgi:hypothetical protein
MKSLFVVRLLYNYLHPFSGADEVSGSCSLLFVLNVKV